MDLLITLLNIAVFQGVVLGVIILKSPLFKSKANNYLAYAIFTFSISLVNYIFDDLGIYNSFPFLRFVDTIDPGTLFPVFIFLYIIHQVDHPIRKSIKQIWLYLPYLYVLFLEVLDADIISNTLPIAVEYRSLMDILGLLIYLLFIPGILMYSYSCIQFSTNHQEKKWLTHLWLLTFVLFGSWLGTLLLGIFLDIDSRIPIMEILTGVVAFLMHWISYFGIYKFRLAKDQEEIKLLLIKQKNEGDNKPIVDLKQTEAEEIKKADAFTKESIYFKKLEKLCANDQIYRDNTLDREKVAEKLGISPGYVSQLVNTITGDNFSTYINRHRVEAVKRLIFDPEFDNYSLLAIGLECGFSSKTTFYNTFKKLCGITPNAYRKAHK